MVPYAGGDEKSGWRKASDTPAPTPSAAEAILSPWLNGRRVLDVQLLPGGLMNRNCRVCIDGEASPVVLRLYDRDSVLRRASRVRDGTREFSLIIIWTSAVSVTNRDVPPGSKSCPGE